MSRWFVPPLLLLALLFVPALKAQVRAGGLPPSVTSIDFGPGPFAPGIPPSVTSLGFGQQSPLLNRGRCCFNPAFPISNGPSFRHHHRRDFSPFGGVAIPVYSMPVYYPAAVIEPVDDTMEQDYGPGPTVFDRRGSTRRSNAVLEQVDERLDRLERLLDESEARQEPAAPQQPSQQPTTSIGEEPETVLVFRDGHTVKVSNYAIVGEVLYDFSTRGQRKISLDDLDIRATEKQNEEHGVVFHLPSHPGS
jgi:hypothetical protein